MRVGQLGQSCPPPEETWSYEAFAGPGILSDQVLISKNFHTRLGSRQKPLVQELGDHTRSGRIRNTCEKVLIAPMVQFVSNMIADRHLF